MNELIEKVLILGFEDLDDRAVEVFKVTHSWQASRNRNAATSPALFFSGIYVNDESEEQIEFVLVNEAGTGPCRCHLRQAYRRYVDESCKLANRSERMRAVAAGRSRVCPEALRK